MLSYGLVARETKRMVQVSIRYGLRHGAQPPALNTNG